MVVGTAWALLGIEGAAIEVERAFQDKPNHLAFGRFAVVIASNVAQTLRDCEGLQARSARGGAEERLPLINSTRDRPFL